jgi:hypothetical protein
MNSVLAIALCLTGAAWAQAAPAAKAKSAPKAAAGAASKPATPQSIAAILDGNLKQVESELVPAVEAMPEDKFEFAPTNGEFNGVRTFALQARHVATTNFWLYAVVSGEKNPVELGKDENGSDTLKTKADIVKYLKDSYAFAHKALNSVPANGWTKEMPGPFGPKSKTSPLSMAVLLQGHQFDHYGQMVEYLRMNGIIPPASRPR